MTSKRTTPDVISNPDGEGGSDLGTRIRSSVEWLGTAVISEVGTIGGTANVVTGVCAEPLIASYVDGQTFRWVPLSPNSAGVSVNWDGKGAVDWRQPDGSALIANDVVAGIAEEGWFDATAGYFRKSQWSQQSIASNALAAVSANLLWQMIGDTTISSAVAQVEHAFTANSFSHIHSVISGVSPANSSVNMIATLRYSGGAIVTLTSGPFTNSGTLIGAANHATGPVDFILDLISATKVHYGSMGLGADMSPGDTTKFETVGGDAIPLPIILSGALANTPDRVRFAFSTGNIDAGRIMTYGLKA